MTISEKVCKQTRPIRVLQFGEGNFLRGFVDYMIDIANEKGLFNGGIVLVKPIPFGSLEQFPKQNYNYTVSLRGRVDGQPTVIERIVTSVEDAVDAYGEYDRYMAYAKLDTLRFVVSNTTEAGIVFDATDRYELTPPNSFPGKLTKFIRTCIETLSSLPSIVVGLFGYLVFLLMTGATWNLLAGAGAVSILCLPLITTTTEDAFRALPDSYREGGLALGTTHWQTIIHVLLPACVGRIITGVMLAAGRGFGEAAALLYTAGQSTNINWSNWNIFSPTCPLNPLRPGETLALHIWTMRTEGSLYANSTQIANFSAAVLVLLVFAFSLLARYVSRRMSRKASGV